jgi:NitT/TauT family transport system substrate-binding protein
MWRDAPFGLKSKGYPRGSDMKLHHILRLRPRRSHSRRDGDVREPSLCPDRDQVLARLQVRRPAAPFLVAIDKGYFKAEGLDVTIDTAAGSLEPINRVASGTYEMGFGDINSLIKFRDANHDDPIKAVFMVYNKPAFSIVSRKSRGVTKPKDLEGKVALARRRRTAPTHSGRSSCRRTASTPPRSRSRTSASRCASRCCRAARSTPSPAFRSRRSSTSKSMNVPVDDIVVMLMADYGVNLYGNTIIVNPKFAADKPEAVKGFLRALVKGLKDTVKDPSTAVDSVIKRNDVAKKPIELERLHMALKDNIVTPEVKANGYGGVDKDRLAKAIDQIASPTSSRTASLAPPTPSTRRSCRPRPTARRTDAQLTRSVSEVVVSAFVALDGVSHAYGGATNAPAVEGLSICNRAGRVRRGGRAVGLRQIHLDEARDGPAVSVQGLGSGGGADRQQAGQDRRHGVPGADPAALAHHAGKPAAAARNRRAASQRNPPQRGRICRARGKPADLGRARRPGREVSLGVVRRHAAAHLALPRADP